MAVQGTEIALAAVVLGTISGTLISISRHWTQRLTARDKARALTTDVEERLNRIEHAVDAIATEVERISESHAFTARILSERLPPSIASGQPGA